MLKYTHGKWSWRFVDGTKPCIVIDDGVNGEINSLQLGDMKLIESAPRIFEQLRKVAYSALSGRLIEETRELLREINLE